MSRWWFHFFCKCSSLPGELIGLIFFSDGLVQPPTRWVGSFLPQKKGSHWMTPPKPSKLWGIFVAKVTLAHHVLEAAPHVASRLPCHGRFPTQFWCFFWKGKWDPENFRKTQVGERLEVGQTDYLPAWKGEKWPHEQGKMAASGNRTSINSLYMVQRWKSWGGCYKWLKINWVSIGIKTLLIGGIIPFIEVITTVTHIF